MKKLIISLFLCASLVSVMAQTKPATIPNEKTKVETKKDAPKKVVEKKITKDGQKPETKQAKK
jgi:photosystem II stability/assembly factor-like uncharacterized protein